MTVLSVPVTFESMRNGDIDVFLGNWLPAQAPLLQPFLDDQLDRSRAHEPRGREIHAGRARTICTRPGCTTSPTSTASGRSSARSIYGIEPGNDGNLHVIEMIEKNEFELGGFKLVESSEQGMLAEVERAVPAKRPIVFLAWAPHPMNTRFNIRYLTGGDASFGPNFGAATVNTLTRAGYSRRVSQRRLACWPTSSSPSTSRTSGWTPS